ncbi:MAG: cobalamin-binding protein [Desulfuromonadales bacterium]|nr:cobalamin-binding protein [Desulfuromonadales bacterium]
MFRILLLILLLASAALPAGAAVVTDALGRPVGSERPPQRIISLVPAVTEILFALELDEQLIAVTRFCTYPSAALAKPNIGDYASPSLEALAALRPDLVIMAADAAGPELLSRLEMLGIAVFVAYPRSLTGTAELIRTLGRLCDRQPRAAALAAELEQTARCARRLTKGHQKVRVLATVMTEPLVVAGPQTLLDDLIDIAGGVNVVGASLSRYPTWGLEAVLAADPDLILVSPHPGQEDAAALYRNWPELSAVRNNRLLSVDADWIQRPGPRLSLGLRALVRGLHSIELPQPVTSCGG